MHRFILMAIIAFNMTTPDTYAQTPIVELKVTPKATVFEKSSWTKPIVIKSAKDAAAHFDKEALDVIEKQVDFAKQIVLVFAWQGSGGDKLTHRILESFPEQIPFSLTPGKTRDLRRHAHVYALRSNVRWSVPEKAEGK